MPLETDTLRVCVARELPHEFEHLLRAEEATRGNVKLAGSSEVLTLSPGAALKITVQHHNEQGTEELESHQAVWDGERIAIDYEFDPALFLEEVQRRQRAGGDEAAGSTEDVELHGRVEVRLKPPATCHLPPSYASTFLVWEHHVFRRSWGTPS